MFRIDRETNQIETIERKTFTELGIREKDHLQEWIAAAPEALGEKLLVIQKEFDGFDSTRERLDLLAVDEKGRLVVIENKLDDSGRDVVWQAIKYASYCSTLKKTKIAEIYRKYLRKIGNDGNAEELLAEFLGADDFESLILNPGSEQRLILVAADFRKEITATVLWLLTHGIDIRCIRVSPFSMNNENLLNFEQIIPTPEAADYMIGISEKEAEVKQTKGTEARRYVLRREFWSDCLNAFKDSHIDRFDNINPSKDNWSSAGSGVRGCPYTMIFTQKEARIQLDIQGSDRSKNKILFDLLFEKKEEIEREFGANLNWRRSDETQSSRIQFQQDFDGFNKESWPEMINWMIDHIEKLELAIDHPLHEAAKSIS